MNYNLVGIDTIRFSVSESGFNTWLRKKDFEKVEVKDTRLKSKVLRKKVEQERYVRVVKINSSYSNKLSNYFIVTKSKVIKRHYIIEVAGLHQPTNAKIHKGTYQTVKALLEKYLIESIDLAFDFLARDAHVMSDRNAIARLLGSTVSGQSFDTIYFDIGADNDDENPLGSIWDRNSLLYYKYAKESKPNTPLNPLWYRLEFRIDGEGRLNGFDAPSIARPKAVNKHFLENLKSDINRTPIVSTITHLAQTTSSYEYFDEQLDLFFDGRVLRHYE